MAGMNMRRAFNKRMLSKLTRYRVGEGSYNEDNDWVEGETVASFIWGVVYSGNKFSQFDEGIAQVTSDGGVRYTDYRALYITDKFPMLIGDKVLYKGNYYNVIQRSDEEEYNFNSFLLEKSKGWKP